MVQLNKSYVVGALAILSLVGGIGIVVSEKALRLELIATSPTYVELFGTAFGSKNDRVSTTDKTFTCNAVLNDWNAWVDEATKGSQYDVNPITTDQTQIKGRCRALQSMVGVPVLIGLSAMYAIRNNTEDSYNMLSYVAMLIGVWATIVLGITATDVPTDAKEGKDFKLGLPTSGPSTAYYAIILVGQYGIFVLLNPYLKMAWEKMSATEGTTGNGMVI